MPDAHANFAYSTVAAGPSPALSGTTLTLATGDGALFPAVPFNATVWPANAAPRAATSEIVRVIGRIGDVLTFTRAQEGTSARAIGVGDQLAATITRKTLTDVEQAARDSLRAAKLREALGYFAETGARASGGASNNIDPATSRIHYTPIYLFLDDPPLVDLTFAINVVAAGLTMAKQGITSADGSSVLASTPNNATGLPTWTATGLKVCTLSASWPIPAEGLYQVAALWVGTTPPRVDSAHGTGKGGNAKKTGAATAPCGRSTSTVSDLVGATMISDGNSAPLWCGLGA